MLDTDVTLEDYEWLDLYLIECVFSCLFLRKETQVQKMSMWGLKRSHVSPYQILHD